MTAADGGRRGTAFVVESAPAKVNLYLHVLGRRPDGYHELDSLIVFADVADRIEARAAETLSLTVDGRFAPALAGPGGETDDNDNLMLRAARSLAQAAGIAAGASLRLTKTLPVAAGIGGGSADAAATLRALITLWRVNVEPATLERLALALGADVPVCLKGQPTRVQGIGERLSAVEPLPDCALVLANSGTGLSTPAVFGAREGPFGAPATLAGTHQNARDLARALGGCRNDLEPVARALAPEIGDVLDGLAGLPGARLVRMSGSGATCFGLFDTIEQATAGAAILARRQPSWWCAAAPVLRNESVSGA